jgi:hypothetical protein
MNKEKATEQLQRLTFDWEENGLFTKLNQTDINAIGVIMSELELANEKLEKIKGYCSNIKDLYKYYNPINTKEVDEILSIIGESNETNN